MKLPQIAPTASITSTWNHFWKSETAVTTSEYALLLVLIAGFLLFSLIGLGNESGTFLQSSADALQQATQ